MPTLLRWLLRLGPTNPIAVRLVQNGSRRTRHLYIRGAYLAVLILLVLWLMLVKGAGGQGTYRELAAEGARTFMWAAYLQIGLICLLAPVFMAGAIAQEANPRTWEILLSTPMTRAEIVLGSLFGRLFFILALLFASLPLFALTQFFGGVPGSSIFLSYLIAGCAAVLVGSCAISLSVSRLVGKRAVFAFYVSVVAYLAVTFALDRWLVTAGLGAGAAGVGVTWMTGINPFLALHALLNPTNYPRAPAGSLEGAAAWFIERPIATWCWLSVLLSTTLVGLSMLTVRSGGLQTIATGASGVPLHRRVLGLGPRREGYRAPRSVWSNPIAWREAASRNGTLGRIIARWSFIGIGAAFGIGLILLYAAGGFSSPKDFRLALVSTVWGELAVITLVGINMAATAISREREDGTLDLLLTTPITQKQYITGKLHGLIAYLIPMLAVPIGTLTLAGLYSLVGEALGGSGAAVLDETIRGGGSIRVPVVLPEAGLVATLVIVPFTAFAVMVGLKWSLQSKGTISSVVTTVGVVGVVSGIVGLCAWKASDSLNMVGAALSSSSPASTVFALIDPRRGLNGTIPEEGLTAARVFLFAGACVSAVVYAAIVVALRAQMERTFDFTTRKLAGTT
ncbi:MAG: ABC transporter permease subunit [Planctomycetes bacterium]|nr:ABC transporter permease subunit [Planctomycetota bacterium]